MIIRPSIILSLFVTICLSQLYADKLLEQTPSSTQISESWRWKTLDLLKNQLIFTGTELEDGTLVFATDHGLLFYDGYHVVEKNFPTNIETGKTLSIWAKNANLIYLNTSKGLFVWENGFFSKQRSFYHFYGEARPLFVENDNGELFTVGAGGIYKIDGKDVQLMTDFKWEGHSLGVGGVIRSGNKLLLTHSSNNTIIEVPFTNDDLKNPKNWKKHTFEPASQLNSFIFKGNKTGEAISLNFVSNTGIHLYQPNQTIWIPLVDSQEIKNIHFTTGISVDKDTLLIFEKTSAYLIRNHIWTELDKHQYKLPLNGTFAFRRNNENIILGGPGESIVEIDLSTNRFQTYPNLHFMCEDHDNRLWFISKEGNIISQNRGSKVWIKHAENVIDSPTTMICSNDGIVWAVGAHEGHSAVCWYNGFEWQKQRHLDTGERISHNGAIQLSDGRILFGSGAEIMRKGKGLVVYKKDGNQYRFKSIDSTIAPSNINCFLEHPKETLWCGYTTLYKLDFDLEKPFQKEHLNNYIYAWIDTMAPAEDQNIYTPRLGLGLQIGKSNTWETISELNNESGHSISTLLSDRFEENTLWFVTNQGLSKYSNSELTPQILPPSLGFIKEEGTLKQSNDQSLWINQSDRIWYFSNRKERVDSVEKFQSIRYTPETDPPFVEITNFGNQTIAPSTAFFKWKGEDKWSKTQPDKIRYSFRIDENDWSPYSTETDTIIHNLSYGQHSFEIRAKDLDGNIGFLEKPVSFITNPPLWKRPWFIAFIVVVFFIVNTLLFLLVRQKIRHVLELKELKLQFFTNISHELKTPLMLIIAPLEILLNKLDNSETRSQALTAYRSSKKMLHLVDQILEFRRTEFGTTKSLLVKQDIIEDIRNSIQSYIPLAEEKSINIHSSFSPESFITNYDAVKIERILSNLVNNSIKYTDVKGTILVYVSIDQSATETNLKVLIEDNGEGISADEINHVFEPFYRVPKQIGKKEQGVGLGLALVKNLLESLNADINIISPIRIDSDENPGTRFELTIPLKIEKSSDLLLPENKEHQSKTLNEEHPWILIVEDNDEVRNFIGNSLKPQFSISYAENGKKGLQKAKSIVPDIIITDIMMPEMDGYELCKLVRNEQITSHIPIIALTALNSSEHELKALKSGASDFISKPISISILTQKITNAIHAQERLQKSFQRRLNANLQTKLPDPKNSLDQRFIERVVTFIETHMADPTFSVDEVAESLHMSRMTLHRKIKGITGISAGELIRRTKLKYAAELLKEGELNISEISDVTGYQDRSHFSASFKKYYHCTPSEFSNKNKKQQLNENQDLHS